jgi:hypothetical protein
MLQRAREFLALLLIGLLPFHALVLTVITRVLRGPGHAPIASLAAWKEAVLAIILIVALIEMLQGGWRAAKKIDWIDGLILGLLVLSLLVTATVHPFSLTSFFYGFKYDFIALIAFLLLRRVPWSEDFRRFAVWLLLACGAIVAAYGIVTFFLPDRFFTWLGYSDQHSLYLPNQAIAAFQQISGSGIRRIQSTFSGPNQFGLWLLLPWAISLTLALRSFLARRGASPKIIAVIALCAAAMFLSFSRSAWLAAFAVLLLVLLQSLPRRSFAMLFLGLLGVGILVFALAVLWDPTVFFRLSSNRGHLERPLMAMHLMLEHPFGLGLGSAGPASNHLHEACVFLLPHDDPSWAKSTPSLCVFVGNTQVQPAGHACSCAFLAENWYLQIGVELGILGFALYLSLIVLLVGALRRAAAASSAMPIFSRAVLYAFIGVCIAGFFLHAWEDAAVAYAFWMLAGVVLSPALL